MTANQLVDSFGRQHQYLRISVTDRCNFKCDYCKPHAGFNFQSKDAILSDAEILKLAEIFVSLGITKIRLTGGEPMSKPGLETLIQQISRLHGLKTVAMTTNGFYLKGKATALKQAGLNGLNISMDSLKPDRFSEITGQSAFYKVMMGIEDAINVGFETLKLNVVMRSGINDDELLDFVALSKDLPINIRFIEFMPFQGTGWHTDQVMNYAEMRSMIEQCYPLYPLRTEVGAVSKDFRIEGHQGTIGFITSMTDSFCASCNRLRLTAEGRLKTCLFQPAEMDLRTLLHQGYTDSEIRQNILRALQDKHQAHIPMQELSLVENNPMIAIGG